ncbi:MAG: hypothetical protein JSV56_01245, partial [Methanomassiliicoccales archaeon]
MREKIWVIGISWILVLMVIGVISHTTYADASPPGWSEDIRVTHVDDIISKSVRIVSDSLNNNHLVYTDYRHGPPELYYMKLDEDGNILIDETLITDLDQATSYQPDIGCDSNDNIHIVWSDVRDSGPIPNIELYYEKLDNFGNTLVDETRITFAPHNSHYPSMTMDTSDNVNIAWVEQIDIMGVLQEEIYYMKLDNNGNTLVDATALTDNDAEESLFPDIEVDSDGEVHIVWLDDRNETGTTQCQDVYYTKLDSNGNTLVDDTKLFVRGDFHRPNIIVDSSDMIHMTCGSLPGWKGNVYKQIYYMKLNNIGVPVIDELRLTNDDGNASHPEFALDTEENLQMVWEDERHGNIELYYMKLDSSGNPLLDELRLTVNSSKSVQPLIAIDGDDNANVVWADDRDYPDDRNEVYYKHSLEGPENIPPTVEITFPVEGQYVKGNIVVQGLADDTDGIVELVQVKIDGKPWDDAQGTASWTYEWNSTNVGNGLQKIYARSYDGVEYSEEYVTNITVDNVLPNSPPKVTITYPEEDTVTGKILIKGTSSDSDGEVQKVQVKIDLCGWIKAKGTTAWSYSWDTTQEEDGEHVIYARAEDDAKEYSQNDSITVNVDNKGNSRPQVNIISPIEGTVSGTVLIRGSASDPDGDGTITSVQIKIEGDWEDAEGTLKWNYTWDTTTLDDGNYEISVRAFDGTDYSLTQSVIVVVDNPYIPTLTVTSFIPSKVSGTFTIQGTASDVDGKIEKIEIQIDDGGWKETEAATYWSYDLDTTELSNGKHIITIRATDDEGEYDIKTFTIDVDNPEEVSWWMFIAGLAILIIFIAIVAGLVKRRSSRKADDIGTGNGTPQPRLQILKCPKCSIGFRADISSPTIRCPNCGLSGTP